MEVGGNNRSVMPLDVLGRTRATLTSPTSVCTFADRHGQSLNASRDRDRFLELLIVNEEFLVNASHQLALITSLPFVHTARRTYRLNGPVKPPDWTRWPCQTAEKLAKSYHLEEGEVVTRFP